MNTTYCNAIANAGGALITHIGLVNPLGNELSGGSPAYARKAVTWAAAANGLVRPRGDLVFDVPAGATVAGWRGYSAARGGTDYGGASVTQEDYAEQGEYTLLAGATSINHDPA